MEAAFVLSMVVALMRGGQFRRLGDLNLTWLPLVLVSAAGRGYIRMAPAAGWPLGADMVPWLYLLSYGSVFTFFWLNRQYRGMAMMALGTLLNFVVIAANGFQMPVLPWALETIGIDPAGVDMSTNLGHRFITEQTRLAWLGDVVPVWIPGVPRQIFTPVPMSIGDFAEITGMFLFVQKAMGAGRRRYGTWIVRL